MSKIPLPFCVGDLSAFASSLRRQLDGLETVPSHVEMLNLLCKAGGYRNFQHFKAQHDASTTLAPPTQPPVEIDFKRIKQVLRLFDDQGRLIRWPKKFTHRLDCLWVMWSRIAPRTTFTEREISDLLTQHHLFGDHPLLRRWLVDQQLVDRTPDGSQYKRREIEPPAEVVELFKHLHG